VPLVEPAAFATQRMERARKVDTLTSKNGEYRLATYIAFSRLLVNWPNETTDGWCRCLSMPIRCGSLLGRRQPHLELSQNLRFFGKSPCRIAFREL